MRWDTRRVLGRVLTTVLATIAGLCPPAALAASGAGAVPQPSITTFAGGVGSGRATSISQTGTGLVVSGDTLYIADNWSSVVRALDLTTGDERVYAGNGVPWSSGDGHRTGAQISHPRGLALDREGNLIVSFTWASFGGMERSVRRIDAGSGMVTTLSSDFGDPIDVAVGPDNSVYVADLGGNRVARIEPGGAVTTVLGGGPGGFSGDGGPASQAQIRGPGSLAMDGAGNLYVGDIGNARVRRVGPDGIVTTVAGSGRVGAWGDGGLATAAQLTRPYGLAVDGAGNLFIADEDNHSIRRVSRDGLITTVVGTGRSGTGGDGGPARAAELAQPTALAVGPDGSLYVGDIATDVVRKVSPQGIITTVAGRRHEGPSSLSPSILSSGDGGPAVDGVLLSIEAVGADPWGTVYVADPTDHRVRRVDPSGVITTLAGTGEPGFAGDGGPAGAALLNNPRSVVADDRGNVYIADGRLRRVEPTGQITTVVSPEDVEPVTGGPGAPVGGLSFGPEGEMYIGVYTGVIRMAPDGSLSHVAGSPPGAPHRMVGPARDVYVTEVASVAADPFGNVFFSDLYGVRKVDAAGMLTEVPVFAPRAALAVDGAGNLFVNLPGRVVRIAPSGEQATVVGGGHEVLVEGGDPAAAMLSHNRAIGIDRAGNLFVTVSWPQRVLRVTGVAAPAGTAAPPTPSTTVPSTTTSTTRPPVTTTTVPKRAPQVQSTFWSQASPTPLDGTGSWVAIADDPAAGPGQVLPAYIYGHFFRFTGGAMGGVGLVTLHGSKFATFTVMAPGGRHDASIPYDWVEGRIYFPFVYQLASDVWGAWVYDDTAAVWTAIGELRLPPGLGKLEPTTQTMAAWFGGEAGPCSVYPHADVLNYPPVGYIGTTPTLAHFGSNVAGAEACAGQTTMDFSPWARYREGALAR